MTRKVVHTTIRDGIDGSGVVSHDLEVRFDNGEKYVPITVHNEDEDVLIYIKNLIDADFNKRARENELESAIKAALAFLIAEAPPIVLTCSDANKRRIDAAAKVLRESLNKGP